MDRGPHFLMTDPSYFEVCYQINPWMQPQLWRRQGAERRAAALIAAAKLRSALEAAGALVEMLPGAPTLPDLVFTANAAVVLDRRVLLARFRHPERQGEEAVFRAAFQRLRHRGIVDEIEELPQGLFQEGAGDCIWDASRGLFWAGNGPRSDPRSADVISGVFGEPVVPLELADGRYYHLDTCFCPLAGGEVLYYPPAFTPAALAAIRARVPAHLRLEVSDAEAQAFCANAVNLGSTLILGRAPSALRSRLEVRGYRLIEIDLAPFIMAGGAAYCMTLRLDRTHHAEAGLAAAE